MARIDIGGVGIEYELLGDAGAPAIALSPGGRMSKDAPGIRSFAEALAAGGRRVLIWDRPNCGLSDLCFEDETESHMQGRMLIELTRTLDLGAFAAAGGSAGARTSLFAALHDPDSVSHLILWWISGGVLSMLSLGAAYCGDPAIYASMGGMAAITGLPTWADQIARNPRCRDMLLAQDPARFIEVMRRWAKGFVPSDQRPISGVPQSDLDRLTMPVLIVRSSERDLYHPAEMTDLAHQRIAGSKLIDPPWTEEEFASRMASADGHFLDWHRLAPAILDFTLR